MNEQVQSARRLIAVVRLANVRLVELHAKTAVRESELTQDMKPVYRYSAKSAGGLNEGVFYVRAGIELEIGSEDTPQVVLIKVQYELEYHLPEDFKAKRAELTAFASVNGVFNAWPYFRETLQSVTQKMNLPPVVLPVYRVPQATPKPQE